MNDKKPFSFNVIKDKEFIKKQAMNMCSFKEDNVKNVIVTTSGVGNSEYRIDENKPISLKEISDKLTDNKALEGIKDQLESLGCLENIEKFYFYTTTFKSNEINRAIDYEIIEYSKSKKYNLNIETIDMLHNVIWTKLCEKQRNDIPSCGCRTVEEAIDCKGIHYSYVEDLFDKAYKLQLPVKGEISNFCSKKGVFIDALTFAEFGNLFNEFRDLAMINYYEEFKIFYKYYEDHIDELKNINDEYDYSKRVYEILNEYNKKLESEFFKKYALCISIFLTYKRFIF